MLDKKIKNKIKKAVKKYLAESEYRIFIFGSWASGVNRRFSDVDIGILGHKQIPGHIIVNIQDELEKSPIPYRVDVVDFQKVSPDFRRVALQKTEYL